VVLGGENVVFLHLATALGGDILFGLMAAVSFATILAVVAGLGVAMASTAANDLFRPLVSTAVADRWATVVFRLTAVLSSAIGVVLAIVLQNENIAFLSALAFGIGIFNIGRQLGGLIGVAGLQTLIDRPADRRADDLAENPWQPGAAVPLGLFGSGRLSERDRRLRARVALDARHQGL